ncbi:hypothetical protein [Actinopolyspora mortivallis]|uniref:hypothetical protein n=1 Tax=Actinopolyspora mortivallis TaxID=33906 RepID=UPI00038163E2|nr:hypothetical protein [Actinopolyspora mortivallis]
MKRTVSAAAALLAGSAGAVGLAGTAVAETPALPSELPTDGSTAQAAHHTATTLHSAEKVVGDVVSAPGASARSGDDVPAVPAGLPGHDQPVPGIADAHSVDETSGVLPEDLRRRDGASAPSTGGDLLGDSPLGGLLGGLPISGR